MNNPETSHRGYQHAKRYTKIVFPIITPPHLHQGFGVLAVLSKKVCLTVGSLVVV